MTELKQIYLEKKEGAFFSLCNVSSVVTISMFTLLHKFAIVLPNNAMLSSLKKSFKVISCLFTLFHVEVDVFFQPRKLLKDQHDHCQFYTTIQVQFQIFVRSILP